MEDKRATGRTTRLLKSIDISSVSELPIYLIGFGENQAVQLKRLFLEIHPEIEATKVIAMSANGISKFLLGVNLDRIYIDHFVMEELEKLKEEDQKFLKIISNIPVTVSDIFDLPRKTGGEMETIIKTIMPKRTLWTKIIEWIKKWF